MRKVDEYIAIQIPVSVWHVYAIGNTNGIGLRLSYLFPNLCALS